jgi:hypothetical protein
VAGGEHGIVFPPEKARWKTVNLFGREDSPIRTNEWKAG